MQVRSLGREDVLEEGTATHSNILAWRIPWTESHGQGSLVGCSPQGQKGSDTTEGTWHTRTDNQAHTLGESYCYS